MFVKIDLAPSYFAYFKRNPSAMFCNPSKLSKDLSHYLVPFFDILGYCNFSAHLRFVYCIKPAA